MIIITTNRHLIEIWIRNYHVNKELVDAMISHSKLNKESNALCVFGDTKVVDVIYSNKRGKITRVSSNSFISIAQYSFENKEFNKSEELTGLLLSKIETFDNSIMIFKDNHIFLN